MASNPPQALRLTFTYEGTQIRIAGSERVAMIVPAPIATPPERGQSGYWFEIRDDAGRIVYHRPLHQPLAVDAEVFSADPRQSIARVPSSRREGQFTILIPDTQDARTFELYGPADPARPELAATTLLRTDVDTLRRMKPPPIVSGGGGTTPPTAPPSPRGRTS
ncbi:MAG TPA: hypothetical protein VJX31_06135 [Casimicrobiaceae bacterium]|nr:hypothetical protein [Casimicrobiaceae bacterium]